MDGHVYLAARSVLSVAVFVIYAVLSNAFAEPPAVSVITPAEVLSETPNAGAPDQVYVRLSEAFPEAVTVNLTLLPPNSAFNGVLKLSTNTVVIPAGQTEATVDISNVKDGTGGSASTGFIIIPTVTATAAAQAHFIVSNSGVVLIRNEAPIINTPVDYPITDTEVAYTVTQFMYCVFYWDVSDVSADLSSMRVSWNYGDGSTDVMYGSSGSLLHRYGSTGDMVVRMVAEDKDGGQDAAQFKIRVAQAVTTTTPVPVPLSWLAQYPDILSAAGWNFEAAAQADADGDGHVAWQEYVAGSIPTNRESVFRVLIAVDDDSPRLTWTPDLGTARAYTVEGKTNLTDSAWGPTNAASRYFRVRVGMP